MNRLTYKLDEPIKTKHLNYKYHKNSKYHSMQCNLEKISNDMIFNKLGKLEDIEEEFGCPLDIIFKALKDRKLVFIHTVSQEKTEITLGVYKILGLMFDGENYILYIYKDNDVTYVYTKDYGKAWVLYDIEVKNE